MKTKRLRQVQLQIERIQRQLQELGAMRPGSLTVQYRDPKRKRGAYYQLSYTHEMKSHTDYVRPAYVAEVRRQIATYRRFKKLVARWVHLAIEQCRLQMDIAKREGSQ